jgi:hypothetical protein
MILLSFVLTALPSASHRQTSYGRSSTDRILNKATIVIAGARPDVSAGHVFKTNNASPTTITNFANGVDLQGIAVICGDTNTTIQNNSTIATSSGTDVVCLAVNQSQDFVYSRVQSKWIQKGRRPNVAQLPNTPLAFSATPSFAASFGASYSMTLTGNVTTSTITGKPSKGNLLSLTLTEDATGGWTFAFPANFIFTPAFTFNSAALAINELTFKFDGTNWHLISNSSAGGTGCTPLGTNAFQKNNSGACAGSNETQDGTTFKTVIDSQFKGPNPYIDIRAFGARAILGTTPNSTASITSGTATATVAGASTFVNGDGVVIRGAGANITISTPGAPTVIAGNATVATNIGQVVANASGATTYQYQIVARTIGGGYTVASTATSISNGPATLGFNTVNISSWTRATNVVTVTTASAHNLVLGSLVNISVDGPIMGWYNVSTVPDNTHFTVVQGTDTRNGAQASGGSTGKVGWWNCNKITWASVTGAWQYFIYGRTAGSMVFLGVSLPDKTFVSTDPLYNVFEDYGSTMTVPPGMPDWVPSTPPVAVKNDDLVTTILSGAGTTTLTLAVNASNTVAGAIIKMDNAANIRAAVVATNTSNEKGVLYIPAGTDVNMGFVTNSILNMAGSGAAVVAVKQAGSLFLGDTLVLGHTNWSGDSQNPISLASQFTWQKLPLINSGNANPVVYESGSNLLMSYVSIVSTSPSSVGLLIDGVGQIPGSQISHVNIGAPSTDFVGHSLVIRNAFNGASNFNFDFLSMSSGPLISDNSPSPLFVNSNGMSPYTFKNVYMNRRGMLLGTGAIGTITNLYEQGAIMPKITLYNPFGGTLPVSLSIDVSVEDTTTNPILAYYSGLNGNISIASSNGVTGGPNVSGPGTVAILFRGNGTAGIGQNVGTEVPLLTGNATDGVFNTGGGNPYPEKILNAGLSIGSPYQVFVNSIAQPAPTAVVSAGGTVALGTYTFRAAPVFASGGEGPLSTASNSVTTTRGNQTVTITWSAVPGAIGYDIFENNAGFQCVSPFVTGGATTSYIWSGAAVCGQPRPSYSGSGPTAMLATGLTAPQLTLASTDGGGMVSVKMPVGTATRTLNLPDATGTALLATGSFANRNHFLITRADGTVQDFGVAPMAVFDSGNRANGTIQSGNPNWVNHANFSGGVNVVGNSFVGGTVGTSGWVLYTGASFPTDDQTVAATITGVGASAKASASILLRASPTVSTGYSCSYSVNGISNLSISKEVAGKFSSLSSVNYSAAAGDRLSCNVTGAILNLYVNGLRKIGPITDASISSGFPGLGFSSNLSSLTLANWAASYGAVSLNVAQTWNAIQNFSTGIQLNGSNTVSSVSGNSGRVGQTSGTLTNLHLASFDANGNIVDSGVTGTPPCTTTALSRRFNNAGAFGCMANFTFTAATGVLTHNQLANGDELLFGKRFTDTTPTGNFIHYQTQAGTDIFKLDVNGNLSTLGGISTGSTPSACTPGTAGSICLAEGTDAANASGAAVIDANSTTHELAVKTNGSANAGMLVRTQPGAVHQTAQTAAITTAALCAASAGACNVAGQYHVHFDFIETGTACSNVTAGSVSFLLTWTDSNATTHSAVVVPMLNQTGATSVAQGNSFTFATALANAGASGDFTISTNGSVIQYATGYTGCTTGTGTYQLDAAVTRVQ